MGEKLIERIMSLDAIPEFNENELETILFIGTTLLKPSG